MCKYHLVVLQSELDISSMIVTLLHDKSLGKEMSMNKQRRKFSAQQKVKMLRQHLVEKVSISEVCDQNGISPTQFYQWQKVFFECGTAAFEKAGNGRKDSQVKTLERQNAHLQAKLVRKDEVIAEIMASHVALKKNLGED